MISIPYWQSSQGSSLEHLSLLRPEEVYAAFRESFWSGIRSPGQRSQSRTKPSLPGRSATRPELSTLSKVAMPRQSAKHLIRSSKVLSRPHPIFLPGWQWRLDSGQDCSILALKANYLSGQLRNIRGLFDYRFARLHPYAPGISGRSSRRCLWGFIPGFLKAKTGGHEVINTIMMNWIAFRLTEWLLSGPMTRPGSGGMPISPMIQKSAQIPQFFQITHPISPWLFYSSGICLAGLVVALQNHLGFELAHSRYQPASCKICRAERTQNTVIGMALSGALAGMAGANQILAINRSMALGLSSGYGFDSIALALIGNSHPVGVVLASYCLVPCATVLPG